MQKPSGFKGGGSKAVVERWWRLKTSGVGRRYARAMMRWILPLKERKNRAALKSAFDVTTYYAIKNENGKSEGKNENGKSEGLSTLFNIGLYLLIANRDIQAVKIYALTHPDEWMRKLSARIILLTIYEWDADQVCGRQLKRAMDLMLIPDDLRKEATQTLRELRTVQERATKKFSFIRNAAIAHRDPNALIQYRAIRNLNVSDVIGVATEFFIVVNKFTALITKLLHAGSTPESFLKQWLTATNEKQKGTENN